MLQVITIDEDALRGLSPAAGLHPDAYLSRRHAADAGIIDGAGRAQAGLTVRSIESSAQSYARTLAEWRERFNRAWPAIAKLGFDEPFRRLWDYYLAYCEVGFESGVLDVGLYKLERGA